MEAVIRTLLVISFGYLVLGNSSENSTEHPEVQQTLNEQIQTKDIQTSTVKAITSTDQAITSTVKAITSTDQAITSTVKAITSTVKATTISPLTVPEKHRYLASICGLRWHKRSRRLIGGTDSAFGDHPWHVRIQTYIYARNSSSRILYTMCGGVIITRKHILSLASCFLNDEERIEMTFGLFATSREFGQIRRSIGKHAVEVFMHKDHKEYPLDHGLAVLKVKKTLEFFSYVIPICLPQANKNFIGKSGVTTGWGMRNTSHFPNRLQEIVELIEDHPSCPSVINKMNNMTYTPTDRNSYFCVSASNATTSSKGDSGNPLVVQRPDTRWELAGTAAYIYFQKNNNQTEIITNIYVNISHHVPWIIAVLSEKVSLQSINTIVKRH